MSSKLVIISLETVPDNKVHGVKMGPTWFLPAPDGPHIGPMNLVIRIGMLSAGNPKLVYSYFFSLYCIVVWALCKLLMLYVTKKNFFSLNLFSLIKDSH